MSELLADKRIPETVADSAIRGWVLQLFAGKQLQQSPND